MIDKVLIYESSEFLKVASLKHQNRDNLHVGILGLSIGQEY